MMVIDAGTIQTPQTLQQIKRLFCKVVKEQNGKRGAMTPLPSPPLSLPPSLTSCALSYHQLLFGSLGVITPSGRRAIYKPFPLARTGYAAACAHMGVCGGEGKYGFVQKGETASMS